MNHSNKDIFEGGGRGANSGRKIFLPMKMLASNVICNDYQVPDTSVVGGKILQVG